MHKTKCTTIINRCADFCESSVLELQSEYLLQLYRKNDKTDKMMKKLILVFLMWNLIACTTEQSTSDTSAENSVDSTTASLEQDSPKVQVENDLAKKNLRGKIKSREVLVYDATVKDGYVTNGAAQGGIKTTYNELGNKVELLTYNEENKRISTWSYSYNDKNKLSQSNYSDDNVTRTIVYEYNTNNQLISSEESVNGKIVKQMTYVYDEDGNEIENRASFVESKGKSRSVNAYDDQGRLRETNIYDEKDELQLKQLYTYNEKGQEIQQSIFTGDNAPSYKRKYEYDTKGNKIKDIAFTGNGVVNPSDTYKYKYEYDQNGNWTTQIRYNYNDVADQFIEQKITYYE